MATKKSDKFIGTGDPQKGVDEKGREVGLGLSEPSILNHPSQNWKPEPYRMEGGKKSKRSTGVKSRERVSPSSAEGHRRQSASKL